MKVLPLLAGVLVAYATLAACGGGKAGKAGETPVPTLAGDEARIVRVLNEYLDVRDNGTAVQLAALFATTCVDQTKIAQQIISAWSGFKGDFDVKVDGLEVEDLQADSATVKATGRLIQPAKDITEALASPQIKLAKEGDSWKIATCGLTLPGTDTPVQFQ
jgi:hypothetical protein